MWKSTVAMVLVAMSWFGDVRSDLLEEVRNATSAQRAAKAAERLEKKLPDGADRWMYLRPLAEVLEQRGAVDTAVTVLTRSKGRVGASLEPELRLTLSRLEARHGRLDAAARNASEGLEAAAEHPKPEVVRSTISSLHGVLGDVHEQSGRYAEAIAEYEQWKWTSWCGTGSGDFLSRRRLAIARCRFLSGDTDGGLDELFALSVSGLSGAAPHGPGPHDRELRRISIVTGEIIVRYAEYAATAGRDDAETRLAKAFADDPVAIRLAQMGTALSALDFEAVLRLAGEGVAAESLPIVGAHTRTVVPSVAVRELKRYGKAVAPAVGRAIVEGNRVATMIAKTHDLPGAYRGLKKRIEIETEIRWQQMITHWLAARDAEK